MNKVIIPIVLMVLSLTGCTHSKVWEIKTFEGGGIIGYEKGTGPEADKELESLIKATKASLCPSGDWKVVQDELRSSTSTATLMVPQTSTTTTSGTVQANEYSNSRLRTPSGSTYNLNSNTSGTANYSGTTSTTNYVAQNYETTRYWREALVECLPTEGQVRMGLTKGCAEDPKDGKSCHLIARSYEREKNIKKSSEHFVKACEKGFQVSCAELKIQSGDKATARKILQDACDNEDPIGCANLGFLITGGRDPAQLSESEFQDAHLFYKRACSLGEDMGCQTKAWMEKKRALSH